MDSFDFVKFSRSGKLLFRGRSSSELVSLEDVLVRLTYLDPYSSGLRECPSAFSSYRNSLFVSNYSALPARLQLVVSTLLCYIKEEFSETPSQLEVFNFLYHNLSLSVICRGLRSKKEFLIVFLYSYYAYLLYYYNPSFSLNDLPF